ncbi:MAG: arsenic efflux protein [Candidatus Krumholzibacteriota bacterium]|nr:arsenic efflux protein [Candidatus Krumholzibacteriota bacterium]
MITGFVFVMMLVIEYINVLTRGMWQGRLARNRFGQYLIAAFLGAVPGCLGSFAVVAMFSHRVIGFGAIVTAMIATSGDEAFVMLAMIPRQALILFGTLFVVGIAAGAITDFITRRITKSEIFCCDGLVIHDEHEDDFNLRGRFIDQWRHCTIARGVLAISLVALVAGIISGQVGGHGHGHLPGTSAVEEHTGAVISHDHADKISHPGEPVDAPGETAGDPGHHKGDGGARWGWVRVTMLFSTAIALFVVATVPDHFLEEHLWEHIARDHLAQIFLWTLGALVFLHIVTEYFHLDVEALTGGGKWVILSAACLIGLIPQSGPHLIFVTLFAQGLIPFSVLLANSIVQDGHGMLPLLAHSRKAFIMIKAINVVVGFIAGALAILFMS